MTYHCYCLWRTNFNAIREKTDCTDLWIIKPTNQLSPSSEFWGAQKMSSSQSYNSRHSLTGTLHVVTDPPLFVVSGAVCPTIRWWWLRTRPVPLLYAAAAWCAALAIVRPRWPITINGRPRRHWVKKKDSIHNVIQTMQTRISNYFYYHYYYYYYYYYYY